MGSKSLNLILTAIRLDLKDSGTLWSDAELTRSLERAVSDLSRYLPQEKFYEESLQFTITSEAVSMPATTSLTAICAAQTIDVAPPALLTISAQPDVPRPLTITIVDADNSTYGATFTIRGTDKDEKAQSEVYHWSRGDSKTLVGKKEFKYVYEVELTQDAGSHAGDTAQVGYGLYSNVWVYLANKPIKYGSETLTSSPAGTTYARDTDYEIDYANGRVRAKAGKLAAGGSYLVGYTKSQLSVDLSSLSDFIRVQRVEYPVGDIPQSFCQWDMFSKHLYITGMGESEEQSSMAEDKHIRVYYDSAHEPPTAYSPSTVPDFLENTLIMAASAYALLIYVLKAEHQAVTDLTSLRTILSTTISHTALGNALTAVKKYLDNNTVSNVHEDAAGLLAYITADTAGLRTAIGVALDAANSYTDAVAATDIVAADTVAASYIGTTNYVAGGTEPDIKKYLDSGDALLNTITLGGENEHTAEVYAQYAQIVRNALVSAFEQHRTFYLDDARVRTNAALVYIQEAAQRLSSLRSCIEQSAGYTGISSVFAREAEARLAELGQYLQEAQGYAQSATGQLLLADRFRTEATERRNEVLAIWKDRKEYIGDFTMGSTRQMPGNT